MKTLKFVQSEMLVNEIEIEFAKRIEKHVEQNELLPIEMIDVSQLKSDEIYIGTAFTSYDDKTLITKIKRIDETDEIEIALFEISTDVKQIDIHELEQHQHINAVVSNDSEMFAVEISNDAELCVTMHTIGTINEL